ncbi:aspartic proteinase CDR1-like [Cicer arietinum]|uniref:aspartic proteinase CDR1-like n=1 Tax=Cicer arietinum TaxID=3827 RepID=UPI003CC58D51
MNTNSFLILLLFSLCFIVFHSHAQNNGFSVDLIHRDSLKSPFYQPATKYQLVVNAVRQSISCINHFYKDSLTDTPKSSVIPDGGSYLMTYSVGTPPFKLFGIADTGSDIIWLQCKPCEECFNQTTPKFEPSKSSSYKNIPCNSNTCQSLRDTSCTEQDSYLSLETLTLDSTTGHSVSFPKTVIGCGTQNTVSFDGRSSGIVGLGGGSVSLTTQLGSKIGGKFSYCLVPLLGDSSATSKLNFGDAAVVSGNGSVSTPLVSKDPKTFYYLTLEAIHPSSVNDSSTEVGSIDERFSSNSGTYGSSDSFGSSSSVDMFIAVIVDDAFLVILIIISSTRFFGISLGNFSFCFATYFEFLDMKASSSSSK